MSVTKPSFPCQPGSTLTDTPFAVCTGTLEGLQRLSGMVAFQWVPTQLLHELSKLSAHHRLSLRWHTHPVCTLMCWVIQVVCPQGTSCSSGFNSAAPSVMILPEQVVRAYCDDVLLPYYSDTPILLRATVVATSRLHSREVFPRPGLGPQAWRSECCHNMHVIAHVSQYMLSGRPS